MSSSARFTDALRRRLIEQAIDFLAAEYELDAAQRRALHAVPVRWRRRHGRSVFYMKPRHGFAGPHILVSVPRGATARWSVYRRVRVGLVAPPQGIEMPVALFAAVVLVHEFTHAIQHGVCGTPKRPYGEVETTDNEIRFIERMAPDVHAQLLPLKAKPRKRGATGTRRVRETRPTVPPDGIPPIWPTRMLVAMWNRLVLAPLGLTSAPARRYPAAKAPRPTRAA
ncbi:MAG: hypothetical protein LW625_07065 [Planctomycetaceae bacterium]|nr:hypothetical protein [Planctomycetaceae bacterium]